MRHFKDEYWATQEDALRVLKRLRKISKPAGFSTALYGSSLLVGGGHDVDLQIMGANNQTISPAQLALTIIKRHAREIHLYHQEDGDEMSDVWLCFVSHDELYVDLHIKGMK